ncbi:MAG: hypothetical protein ACREXU_13935 [Gammaproteobacteria bacterium]
MKRPEQGGGPAPAALPCIRNAREAAHWLEVFENERREVLDALDKLRQRFPSTAGRMPARLVPRRGGGLLWRLRSASPKDETLFELTGPTGRALLQRLPPPMRRLYLDVEAERLKLNARWAITNTVTRSLAHYLDRYQQVRALRKSSETA